MTTAVARGAPRVRLKEVAVGSLILASMVPAATGLVPFGLLPEHLLWGAVGLLGFILLLGVRHADLGMSNHDMVVVIALLAWGAWSAARSIHTSPEPGQSLTIVAWQMMAVAIGLVVSSVSSESPGLIERMIRLYCIAVACVAVAGVSEVLLSIELSSFVPGLERAAARDRAQGFMSEPNLFGSQCAIAVSLMLTCREAFSRRVGYLVLAASAAGLLLSLTRAAWVAAAVGAGIAMIPSRRDQASGRRRMRVSRLVAFGIGVVGAVVLLGPGDVVSSRYQELTDVSSGTGAYRVESWSTAVSDLQSPSAVGLGLGTNSFGQRHRNPYRIDQRAYLSNVVLVSVYDAGLLGAGLFAMLLWAFALRRVRHVRRYAVVACALIAGLATNPFWFGYVWIAIGLARAWLSQNPEYGADQ